MTRLLVCIFAFCLCLYAYIDKQNRVTELRLKIPEISKEIRALAEENCRMQYEIDQFENPQHLMELAALPEYSHLKHPLLKEVVTMKEAVALQLPAREEPRKAAPTHTSTIALGAR